MRTTHSSTAYRNFVIRSVASLAGDLALTAALIQACSWLIEVAALGLFLKFMLWLLAALLALAASQYLVHPAVNLVLADDKLDRAINALANLRQRVERGMPAADPAHWLEVLAGFSNRVGATRT